MQVHNLHLYRGDTHVLELVMVDSTGKPFDLSGLTASMVVKPTYGNPITPVLNIKGNTVNVEFPSHLTRDVRWRAAQYDLKLIRGNVVRTVLRGKLTLEKDVSL